MNRFVLAIQCFWRTLVDPEFARTMAELKASQGKLPSAQSGPSAAAMLAILQKDGRLLDFLMEKIDGYPDAQVGAVARTVHGGCRKALNEYLTVEPVLADAEGSQVTVAPGFDPATIRVVGNVSGNPPFKGALKHHGWRVSEINLPSRSAGPDGSIIMPAEVEI
ncbi:MAG TPA: DUF2760 domain-containing protein [Candidatus Xenobia bacterium]|jgi:hypothetical protein